MNWPTYFSREGSYIKSHVIFKLPNGTRGYGRVIASFGERADDLNNDHIVVRVDKKDELQGYTVVGNSLIFLPRSWYICDFAGHIGL